MLAIMGRGWVNNHGLSGESIRSYLPYNDLKSGQVLSCARKYSALASTSGYCSRELKRSRNWSIDPSGTDKITIFFVIAASNNLCFTVLSKNR